MMQPPPPPQGFVLETAPATGSPRPILPRQPPPQTPVQAGIDEATLRLQNARAGNAENLAARGGLTAVQRQALEGRYGALGNFETAIDGIEAQYRERLQGGQGGILGVGGRSNPRANLPYRFNPGYRSFDQSSGRLIDSIAEIYGISGGELNSLAELRARLGPYLPLSTDDDETIESKIAALRQLLTSQRGIISGQLGIEQQAAPAQGEGPPPIGGITTTDARILPPGEGGHLEPVRSSRYGRDTETVDPAQTAINEQIQQRVSNMLNRGASDAEIRAYGRSVGTDVEPALQYRRGPNWQRWRRENPNEAYPMTTIENRPLGALEGTVAGAASSAPGTAIIHSGNAAIAGTLPLIADAFGDGERVRLGLDATREAHPLAALAGDIAGGTMAYSGAGRLVSAFGRTAVGSRLPAALTQAPAEYSALTPRAVAGDAAYGALQGAGENRDPISGIAESVMGGVAGRGAVRGVGSAVSPTGGGMRGAYAAGVRPTLGQRFRGTAVGDTMNFAEEASQSVPIGGRLPRRARQRARDQWERGAWNQSLENLTDPTGNPIRLPDDVTVGPQAHRFAQRSFDDAYDDIRGRLSFQPDSEWTADLATINADAALLASPTRRRFDQIYRDVVDRRITNGGGALSGGEFKTVASDLGGEIRRLRRLREPTQNQQELLGTLDELDSALHQGARRHSAPEVVAALDQTDRGYAMLTRLENASRRRPLQVGRFTPSDLLQTEAREGGIRGRRFSAGDGLYTDYAESGRMLEDVLPSSGTSERIAMLGGIMAGGGAGGGGAVAAGVDPMLAATVGGGVAAAPILYRASGVAPLLERAMAPRPPLDSLADLIRRRARMGGRVGGLTNAYGTERD